MITEHGRRNLEVIRGIYAAFDRGDLDALFSVLHPKIHWVDVDLEGRRRAGRTGDSARSHVEALRGPLRGCRAHVEQAIAHGDRVLVRGVVEAPDDVVGEVVAPRFWHVWVLREGCPVHFRTYARDAKALAALKLAEAAPIYERGSMWGDVTWDCEHIASQRLGAHQ